MSLSVPDLAAGPRTLPKAVGRREAWSPALAALTLIVLFAACGPLFVCQPPWVDVTFFDLCARTVLRGGTLYKDVFLHGPPGMVLLQAGLRWLVGWSSEAWSAADLVVVAAVVYLLTRALRRRRGHIGARRWTAAVLFAFYLSTSEWCHGQPDTWMLLPTLAAVGLRRRQVAGLTSPRENERWPAGRALAEGSCWGVAFLLKPFVAAPALACWLVSAAEGVRLGAPARRRLAAQARWVTVGVLAVGGLTVAWLWHSGNWPYFLEGAAGAWNQDYYGTSPGWRSRLVKSLLAFWPWGLVHLVAVPEALVTIGRTLTMSRVRLRSLARSDRNWRPLLAAVYLAWYAQADFVQRQLIYQLVPGVLLALALLASGRGVVPAISTLARHRRLRWLAAAWFLALATGWVALYAALVPEKELLKRDQWLGGFVAVTQLYGWFLLPGLLAAAVVCTSRALSRAVDGAARLPVVRGLAGLVLLAWAVAQNPLLAPERLAVWDLCWIQGSTPGVRNALTVEQDTAAPDWVALEAVKEYLTQEQVRERELTCYAISSMHLYKEMDLTPSTRFALLWPALLFFHDHKSEIVRELRESPQRFIVGDLVQDGFSRRQALGDYPGPFGLPALPERFRRQFPWNERVVFRAGRYLVHRVAQPRPVMANR